MKYTIHNVSVIIPNWNGVQLMRQYLANVVKELHGAEIIVVDDASTDKSVQYVEKTFPDIILIQRNKHQGFSATVNTGVSKATRDILLLLNTDIEPEKGFLEPLLHHFSDPNIFAVACMDKSVEQKSVILRGRGIAWWEKGFWIHKRGDVDTHDTAWVSCGSGAFRKSMWEELGGLDEMMNPFYWEDIDLSYRARKAGYTIRFEPKSIVVHHHEEGSIQSQISPQIVKRTAFRNQLISIWKNITDPTMLLLHAVYLPLRIFGHMIRFDGTFFLGFCDAWIRLPRILYNRFHVRKKQKLKDKDLLPNTLYT